MTKKIIFISEDGKEFNNQLDCMEYELTQSLNKNGVKFFNKNNEPILDATQAYTIIIADDSDLIALWDRVYDYCGADKLPMQKGTWEWQDGQENRLFCEGCSYHCHSTGEWTCQSNGNCYEGGWVKKQ